MWSPSRHVLSWAVRWGAVAVAAGMVTACSQPDQRFDLPERVDYNFHVRPVLSNTCYVCHGPDASTREANLRLDLRAASTARREGGGRAIHPGSAKRSLLIRRVTSEDAEERMPPAESNHRLSPREIALIARWIDQGAEYKPPWALIRPAWPSGSGSSIDELIDERLAMEGLPPAARASKQDLARRASFVLTGLPPTLDELRSFVEDTSASAYKQLVDQLLDSPRYGERWARHWLDLVRFAESKGHEFDFTIQGAWRYRDYLIRAFNADLPYDSLVIEHLAGDQLAQPRLHPVHGYDESLIGTSYLALGEGKHSPVDTRQDEADRIDNIIDVTSKTFQGLTLACARCHDHKFDPIPTTDYYAFYGIFESTRFTYTPLVSSSQQARIDSLQAMRSKVRGGLGGAWKLSLDGRTALPVSHRTMPPARRGPWLQVDSTADWRMIGDFTGGSYDGWFPQGPAFGPKPEQGRLVTERGRVDSLVAGVVSSRNIAAGMPGALRSPTFTLDMDSIHVVAAGQGSTIRLIVDNFQLINPPIFQTIQAEVNSPTLSTYRFNVELWKGRKAYIEFLVGRFHLPQYITGIHRIILDDSAYVEAAYAVLFDSAAPGPLAPPESGSAALPSVRESVDAWVAGEAAALQVRAINEALAAGALPRLEVSPYLRPREDRRARLEDFPYVMAVTEGDRIESPVFVRGNYQTLGEAPVPHRFLSALSEMPKPFGGSSSGRYDLARAIASPMNPLTARVMVNRLWHHAFGRGIVETVDNFGAQGALPTHPELLDYLALRFVEQGWSTKAVLREMLLSEAFQRSTVASEPARTRDPLNLLLSHYSVRRLDAEAIRDAVLAVSGALDTTMYGPSVPTHLTEFMNGPGRPETSGPLDGAGRRSVYQEVRRNFLSPMMLAFDRPIPFSTFGARNTTNVPAQSLTMLNDPFVAQQARVWADSLVAMDGLDVAGRIRHIYVKALSRPASAEEIEDGLAYFAMEGLRRELGDSELLGTTELWADYVHVVFNLKEFLYLL